MQAQLQRERERNQMSDEPGSQEGSQGAADQDTVVHAPAATAPDTPPAVTGTAADSGRICAFLNPGMSPAPSSLPRTPAAGRIASTYVPALAMQCSAVRPMKR